VIAIDDLVYGKMGASPLLVLSPEEIERLAQLVHTPEEIAQALWDYAWIAWQRGQRFERARAADAATRWWHPRELLRWR
jgi:hypothetical protein